MGWFVPCTVCLFHPRALYFVELFTLFAFFCSTTTSTEHSRLASDRRVLRTHLSREEVRKRLMEPEEGKLDEQKEEEAAKMRFLPGPCHSPARYFSMTGRRTDKGLWETDLDNHSPEVGGVFGYIRPNMLSICI